MPDRSRRAAHLIVGVLAASSILAVGTINSPSVSAAATYIDAGGLAGHVGVDYGTGQYASVFRWGANGPLEQRLRRTAVLVRWSRAPATSSTRTPDSAPMVSPTTTRGWATSAVSTSIRPAATCSTSGRSRCRGSE